MDSQVYNAGEELDRARTERAQFLHVDRSPEADNVPWRLLNLEIALLAGHDKIADVISDTMGLATDVTDIAEKARTTRGSAGLTQGSPS